METKLKTPMVFAINYPNLLVKVLNNDTKQYELYKEFKVRDYKTSDSAILSIYEFIAEHINAYHFNGAHNIFEFAQNVKSYNGYYGN